MAEVVEKFEHKKIEEEERLKLQMGEVLEEQLQRQGEELHQRIIG